MPEQDLNNHTRFVPIYHVGVLFPFLFNFCWAFYRLFREFSTETAIGAMVATALILMFFSVRGQIVTVQDRVIRLEERLRYRELLPAELTARALALPVRQQVALRFASDAELPGLVKDVLEGKLTTAKEIKQSVKSWRADFLRA